MATASVGPARGDFPPVPSGAFAPCDPTGVSAASGLSIPSAYSARALRARRDVPHIAALRCDPHCVVVASPVCPPFLPG
ncbi:hypothetical protein BVI2075_140041 [Burkholderia vietnamiensis]|nr:hypothetical protein BVI2075_140041 [Burkholderia vietnamiensis]